MANNIALDPNVLKDQSKQLDNLAKSYEGFYQKVEAEFGSINENWGSDLVTNFVDKITRFKSTETELIESLKSAAKKAEASAYMFEHADRYNPSTDVASVTEEDYVKIKKDKETLVTYSGKDYRTVKYDASCIKAQSKNYNCTSTAWAMGLQIITGRNYDPNGSLLWSGQANWVYYEKYLDFSTHEASFKTVYDQIQAGKPCVYWGYNGNPYAGHSHAVTVVGIREGADKNALTMDDFLVLDPNGGSVKKMSEVGFKPGYTKVITYNVDAAKSGKKG